MAQIGTIRLQTQNNGTVSVPVFDTADAGNNVYDMVRVQTASGAGFIPFVSPGDAAYPYLRIQTQNQGVLAAHNDATLVQTLLQDDFNDGNYNGWTVVSGTWAVENGVLHQNSGNNNSDIYTSLSLNTTTSYEWEFDMMQEETFYGKNVQIWSDSNDFGATGRVNANVNFTNQNHNPDYAIQLNVTPVSGGTQTQIAEIGNQGKGIMRHIRVTYDGSGFWELYVDGSFIGSGSVQTMSANSSYFGLRYDQQGQFDNVVVRQV